MRSGAKLIHKSSNNSGALPRIENYVGLRIESIGAILCAYLATGETPTVFEKCNIKGTRNLRNVLAHRINKKEHEGKKEDRTKKAHEKHLSKFERLNSCKFQRNKEGFLDLSSPANLELIGGHASKMIHCLRLLINGRLGLETVNAQIQLG